MGQEVVSSTPQAWQKEKNGAGMLMPASMLCHQVPPCSTAQHSAVLWLSVFPVSIPLSHGQYGEEEQDPDGVWCTVPAASL